MEKRRDETERKDSTLSILLPSSRRVQSYLSNQVTLSPSEASIIIKAGEVPG